MAQAFAEVGVKSIAILDVRQDLGDQAAAEMFESTGIPTSFYAVDIRDGNAVAKVVDKISKSFGSVDILVNSAGIAE